MADPVTLTPEKIAELEATHGECARLRDKQDRFVVLFRRPTRVEHRMFRSAAHNPAKIADAQEELSLACVVFPSKADYAALLERFPGIPDSPAFATAMQELVGMGAQEVGKG